MGLGVAAVGAIVIGVAVRAPATQFQSPRWVVGSVGGAFLFLGGWIAGLSLAGYDPAKGDAALPSPAVQLAVLLPAMLFFAAPFHWIAFWPGERAFQSSLSIPFVSWSGAANAWMGRVVFGAGAILIDALIVALVVRLVRKARAGR
jgi:hypothetical protein